MATAHNAPAVPVTVLTALDAYKWVAAQAGNSLVRDGVDLRQIDHLLSQGLKGGVIADETWVGGMPSITGGVAPTDTDRDGMPDSWEVAHGLNSALAADGSLFAASTGYTNVEIYLNSLAAVPEPSQAALLALGVSAFALCQPRRGHQPRSGDRT